VVTKALDWSYAAFHLIAAVGVTCFRTRSIQNSKKRYSNPVLIEGSLEVKLPTIWTDEKQSREEVERRERVEER